MSPLLLRRPASAADLRSDAVAGVTVAAYAIPQVMAYAGVAGLGAIVGVWSLVPALALYAVLGSSRHLSVGPESTTAVMTAVIVGRVGSGGDPARYAALVATLAALVGAVSLLAWVLRLGFLADLLSRPVLVGYLAGVAILMAVGQLHRVSGVPVHGDSVAAEVSSFVRHLSSVHWPTLTLAVCVIAALFVAQYLWPSLPAPLMAVMLASLAVWGFSLRKHGIQVVGSVPSGIPGPHLLHWRPDDIRALMLPALGVAVVAFTDNMLTARAFASRNGYDIDANRELLALGAANLGSALFRGMPVSSSGSRSALGEAAGARTQWASLSALLVVALTLLLGSSALSNFPQAALGALIIYAAVRLIDVQEIRRLARFRRSELMLAIATTAGVLAFDISYGVLLAVVLSVADVLRRIARPHDAILGTVPGIAGMHDVDDYPSARTVAGLVVYRYDASLFFANAEDFRRRALAAAHSMPHLRWFVLNVEANMPVDITGLDAMEDLRSSLAHRGVVFALARVKHDLLTDLRASGLADRIGEDYLFPTLPTAVAAYEAAVAASRAVASADAPTPDNRTISPPDSMS